MKYEYHYVVTLGDTDFLKNMNYVHFFRLQSVTRELWVQHCVTDGPHLMENGLKLLTRSAHCDYLKSFYLYDPILVTFQVADYKQASAKVVFEFLHQRTGTLHATGQQEIVFLNIEDRIMRIPDHFIDAFQQYSTCSPALPLLQAAS